MGTGCSAPRTPRPRVPRAVLGRPDRPPCTPRPCYCVACRRYTRCSERLLNPTRRSTRSVRNAGKAPGGAGWREREGRPALAELRAGDSPLGPNGATHGAFPAPRPTSPPGFRFQMFHRRGPGPRPRPGPWPRPRALREPPALVTEPTSCVVVTLRASGHLPELSLEGAVAAVTITVRWEREEAACTPVAC